MTTRIFYRRYRCPFGDERTPEGPIKDMPLRKWEVGVILCSQYEEIDDALRGWLEEPTNHRLWPWLATFSRHRAPLGAAEVRKPVETLLELFTDEMKVIRQTLDFPIEVFCGISRDVLLAIHGQRLRWLVSALGRGRALKEIERLKRAGAR